MTVYKVSAIFKIKKKKKADLAELAPVRWGLGTEHLSEQIVSCKVKVT